MENRDRDKLSQSDHPTDAGNVNRETSSRIGKEKSDSDAEFGQNIGKSENLNEPSDRTGSKGSDSGSRH